MNVESSTKTPKVAVPIAVRRHPQNVGTVDHYLALVLGGEDVFDNYRWACFDCNNQKGDLSPEEWEKIKPPYRPHVTKAQRRIMLLSSIKIPVLKESG